MMPICREEIDLWGILQVTQAILAFLAVVLAMSVAIAQAPQGRTDVAGARKADARRRSAWTGRNCPRRRRPHPDPLPTDMFTSKNFYKDKALWLDKRPPVATRRAN
jgi:hypothetical protein